MGLKRNGSVVYTAFLHGRTRLRVTVNAAVGLADTMLFTQQCVPLGVSLACAKHCVHEVSW